MRIRNVEIKGYKSINPTGVSFSIDEMAAFIGKNSAGKSNLLEALECFFNNSTLSPEDFYRNELDTTIEITVDFLLDDDDIDFECLIHANQHNIIRIRKKFICGQKPQAVIIGGWNYTEDDYFNPLFRYTAASIRRPLNDTIVQAFLASHFSGQVIETPDQYITVLKKYWADHFESMPKEWEETERPLPKEVVTALPAYYYLPVTYTVGDETKLGKNSRFQAIYNHILGSIDELVDDVHTQKIKKQIELLYKKSGVEKRRMEVNKILASIDSTNSGTNMHIEFAPIDLGALSQRNTTVMIDDGFDSNVGSKGHGIQRDAIFRLLRAYTQLKSSDRRTHFILAVDEPELYMHPTYKRSLYASFVELSNSGCQIMYTTHDPAFVSVARFDDIHIVRKEQGTYQHTDVASCSLSKIKKTEIFRNNYRGKSDSAIRLELQHKCHGEQNEGFFADKIIIVEGATEQYALPIYFRKIGYDLDTANISIVTADSVTLVAQLCTIFSALSIPCYCIFDGDKPKADIYEAYLRYVNGELHDLPEKIEQAYKGMSRTLTRNKELIKCISGQEIDGFQETTYSENYTMWERNFEENVHEKVRGYRKTRDSITRTEGISSGSKPLVAAAVAECYASRARLPRHLEETIKEIATRIRNSSCVELRFPQQLPLIVLYPERSDGLLPVFSCAAGRNTIVDANAAIGYAEGVFPTDTNCLVHIQGESMEPLIPNDSYVAVKSFEGSPNPGDYIICSLDGGEMVCKQYIQYTRNGQNVTILKSLNRDCEDIVLTEDNHVVIQGKVLGTRRSPACYQTD